MTSEGRLVLLAGSLLAAIGVGLGAFGAHALSDALGPKELGWWQTAVQYQMWHAVALIAVAALPVRIGWAATLLAGGTIIFSASLYILALTGVRWLGAVTPVGGTLMIGGWLLLAWRVWSSGALANR